MKRKMLSVLLVVLVVCLAASMLVLSACNPKEDDKPEPQKPSTERSTTDMMNDIWANIQNSYQLGEKFGVDVSASFVIDDKTAKDNDVTFTLTAKGNADLQDGATDDKTAFVLELTKKAKTDEKATTILGLAYEVIENQPYFFGNVMGEYRKINGYSLTALYRAIAKKDASAAAFDMSSITEYIPMVIGAFFGSTGTVENNVYTLKFDLADLASSLEELWGSVGSVALGALNITQEQLDGYVKQFFGDLTYETRTGEENVESLEDLFIYLQREMTFEGKLAFKFDQNDKFDSANLSFDYAKKDTPVANYTIRIDKAFVGTSETPVNVFADFALSQDERKNNEAINLLNFKVNGTVLGLDAEGNRQHTYEVAIVSDIDPFALCELLKGTDRENVLATLKKLGYFHFEVNEVNGAAKTNVLTLHSKFDEGTLALRVMALDGAAGVGGIYTFEEVYDLIVDLATTEPSDPSNPEQPEQPSDDSSFSFDKVKEVVAKVKAYLAYFTFDDVATNGVTVEVKNLVNALLNEFGIKVEGIAKSVLDVILQDDAMNFKLNAEYGTASVGDYVDTTDVYSHNALNFKLNGTINGLDKDGNVQNVYEVSAIADIDAFQLVSLIKDQSEANIIATLKKLGYFHLEVNQVLANGKSNIITLHSNFAEGKVIATATAYDMVGIGGEYTFEEIVALVKSIISSDDDSATASADEEASSPLDVIKEYLAYVHYDDVANKGVTVDVYDLAQAIIEKLGVSYEGIVKDLAEMLLVNDKLNIKFNTPEYGKVTEADRVETSTINSHPTANFKLNGTVNGLDSQGAVKNTYEVSVVADVDVMQLLALVKDQSEAKILATLKKLGYFHLEVNRVTAVGKSNVITLHSNFAEGKVVAAVKAYDMLGIGGEFTFEEIANIVKGISGGSNDTQSEAMAADDSNTGILDTIKEFLTFVKYENVATNGVTVEIGNIVEKVFGQLGVPYEGLIESLIDMLLVNDSFNVKFNAPVYGGVTAEDKIATENVNAHPESNFSILGTATGYKEGGSVAHNYTIEVQSDLNLNALLGLIGDTSKENIVATLKRLGYFHLEINEVFSNKDPLNIITLHSNFAEGFAVVNVHTYGAIIYKAGVGGVYDFDALVDVIDMLINKPSEPGGEQPGGEQPGGEQPGEETSIVDTIKNVVNTVKEYLAFFNADNMKENGVTVQLKDLVFHLLDALGVDTKGIIGTGVGAVLGSDSMNVKLQTPVYGQCEKVATDSIVCTIREASAFKDGKNDFIKEIKSVDGFALKAYKGTDINNYSSAAALDLGKAFRITGKNLKGEDVVTSGYIMGVKGLDLSKVGKQNVTLYVAIANDVLDLSKAGLALGDDIPIAGALKFETEFEVLDPQTVTAENISLVNTKTPTNTILYTKEIFEQVTSDNPYMNINGIYRPIGESDMKVVDANGNAVELVDGKIAKGGAYKVYFETAGFKSDYIEISVVSAYAKRTDGHKEVEQLVLGEVWNYDPYEVWVVTKDGETKVDNATAKFTLGSATGLNNIFDITKDANGKDVYTLKKNLDFAGKNLTITFSRLTIAGNKYQTVKAEIPVVCADGYTVSKAINSNYITNTLNGGFEITQNGVAYSVVWNGTAFEAVAADGSKLADFSMSLTWATRKIAVELDKQGCITNIANKNMASLRTEKIACEIKVGDYTYTDDFTFNELYASNKSFGVEVGATLDGYIGNVNKLYYVDANGEQQELEFKNGKDGYAIYVKDTDTKVYDVTVTVTKDNAAVELVEGAFAETGKYRVSYTVNVNGIDQTFYHDVTVK